MKRTKKSGLQSLARAESAQYALLCRVAPALRHRMVGRLHPIGLTAGVAERQLRTDRLDLVAAKDSIAKVQLQTREAIVSSIATLAWITGEEPSRVAPQAGVDTCIELIRTDCEMRGVSISSVACETDVTVSQYALRIVFTAVLLALVDTLPRLSRIEVRSNAHDGASLEIHFDLTFADASRVPTPERRPLSWDDVEALAEHAGIEVFRTGKLPLIKCRFDTAAAEPKFEASKTSAMHAT